MLKLLPEEMRGQVMSEYVSRRTVVMLLSLIFILVVAIVGLFPSYIVSQAREREMTERLQALGQGMRQSDESLTQKWLSEMNLKLKLLSPKLDQVRPSELASQALSLKNLGIKITTLGWSKSQSGESLTLSGVAQDRQALLTFESRLNNSGKFSSVILPLSNLTKERDIPFEAKLVAKESS